MICKDCAHAADSISQGPVIQEVVDYAKATHDLCQGCDCQHRVDLQVEGRSVRT